MSFRAELPPLAFHVVSAVWKANQVTHASSVIDIIQRWHNYQQNVLTNHRKAATEFHTHRNSLSRVPSGVEILKVSFCAMTPYARLSEAEYLSDNPLGVYNTTPLLTALMSCNDK